MNNVKQKFTGQDLAFIIPTKDRPQKIRNVLESIAGQTVQCGRIIIIDGGQSVKERVMGFSGSLPVEYYECSPPGQLRQKKMGISLLDERTPLVGFLDDDIVLEPKALEAMISFWNECEADTAGISFNIINAPAQSKSRLVNFLTLSSSEPGRVMRSGVSTAICYVSRNICTQWLCGGATVWRQQILKDFPYQEILSRWAVSEDLIYSYPVGKKYPMYVCADAKARHEHVIDYVTSGKHRYRGYNHTIWNFYFVESHPELSRSCFIISVLMGAAGRCMIGLFTLQSTPIEFALGQLEGIIKGLFAIICGKNLSVLLNENTNVK